MRSRLSVAIAVLLGAWGVFLSAPGFRPKHITWIVQDLWGSRGVALLAFCAIFAALAPTALFLKRRGLTKTLTGGLIVCLCFLLSLDLFASIPIQSAVLETWVIRLAIVGISMPGWFDRESRKVFLLLPSAIWKRFRADRTHPLWKVAGCIVLFFLLREQFQTFIWREPPFHPFGDEIGTWHSMSADLASSGVNSMLRHNNYFPGVPWLSSLAARVFGITANAEWLYSYAAFLIVAFTFWIVELSEDAFSFFLGISVIAFVFIWSRDYRFYFFGTLYGEATAALLLSIALGEFYLRWMSPKRTRAHWMPFLGFGGVLGFCGLCKPPLSSLVPLFALTGAILWTTGKRLRPRILLSLEVVCLSVLPNLLWKFRLAHLGSAPIYGVRLHDLFAKGFSFPLLREFMVNFVNPRVNGFSLFVGLYAAFICAALNGKRKLLVTIGAVTVSYWGFIILLYCTYWQNVETGSAGRYFSHSAVACALLVPLAFSRGFSGESAGARSADQLKETKAEAEIRQ